MPYKFNDNGKLIDIAPETWRWIAVYDDGSQLNQFEEGTPYGVFHQFKEIDQNRLVQFRMTDGSRVHLFNFDRATMKLIHFYRRIVLNAGTEIERRITLYCYGYQDQSDKHTWAIMPSGEVVDLEKLQSLGAEAYR